MLIQSQALTRCLQQELKALYALTGQDYFLLNEAAETIKSAWRKQVEEGEETVLTIESPGDWALLAEKVNSYSLFSNYRLIDVRFEKKTLDAPGKSFFKSYLQKINSQCLLIVRAPLLGARQLQSLMNSNTVQIVQATPLNKPAMQKWIAETLQKKSLGFEQDVPELIWQYTQGNMLACAQLLEKLELIREEKNQLTIAIVKEQLVDQCNYQLFELSEACLAANPGKAMQLLQHARDTKIEPTLVLWLLSQEIRQLIQLGALIKQSFSFNEACNQLKIWPSKKKLYQEAIKQIPLENLLHLLQFCKMVDERIKTNEGKQIWHALEQIALSLCLRKHVTQTFA